MNCSMQDAAVDLERLCDEIENGVDLDAAIVELFAEKGQILADTVDKRIRYIEYLNGQIAHAQQVSQTWHKRKMRLSGILDTVRSNAIALVKTSKVPLAGTLGKLRVVKNPTPALIYDENDENIKKLYTATRISLEFNKAILKQDLMDGLEVKGARLQYGEHLRY